MPCSTAAERRAVRARISRIRPFSESFKRIRLYRSRPRVRDPHAGGPKILSPWLTRPPPFGRVAGPLYPENFETAGPRTGFEPVRRAMHWPRFHRDERGHWQRSGRYVVGNRTRFFFDQGTKFF